MLLWSKGLIEETGMAETRAAKLGAAMGQLHSAVGQMDRHNLKIMRETFPALMETLAHFGKIEQLNTFEQPPKVVRLKAAYASLVKAKAMPSNSDISHRILIMRAAFSHEINPDDLEAYQRKIEGLD